MPRLGTIGTLALQLVREDDGQDLIEYALLTGVITAGTIVVLSQLVAAMGGAYNSWNTAAQNAWEPCPPASSGLPCS